MKRMDIPASPTTRKPNVVKRVVRFYIDGFREMTWLGRSLWALIIVKLVILFLVFKLFFFTNHLQQDYDNDADRADAVRTALLK